MTISRAVTLVLLLIVSGLFSTASASTNRANFVDVLMTPYEEPVGRLYALDLVKGMTPTHFEPNGLLTRAQMTELAIRLVNPVSKDGLAVNLFDDVPPSHWANQSIQTAWQSGLVLGDGDGRFRPEDPVTLVEAATVLLRVSGLETPLTRVRWPTWHNITTQETGLASGIVYDSGRQATRGEIAIMIDNLIRSVPLPLHHIAQMSKWRTAAEKVQFPLGIVDVAAPMGRFTPSVVRTGPALALSAENPRIEVVSGPALVELDTGDIIVYGTEPIRVRARLGPYSTERSLPIVTELQSNQLRRTDSGGRAELTAIGITAQGTGVPVMPVWSIKEGVGSIGRNVISLGKSPVVTTVGTFGSLRTETVVLNRNAILTILPENPVLLPGVDLQLSLGVKGESQPLPLAPRWSVAQGSGNISNSGHFRSGSAPATILAEISGETATTNVVVGSRVRLSHQEVVLQTGQRETLYAWVETTAGDMLTGLTIALPPGDVTSKIGADTLYGNKPGSTKVTVTAGGRTVDLPVYVGGPAQRISLSAKGDKISASPFDTQEVRAHFLDGEGRRTRGPIGRMVWATDQPTRLSLSHVEGVSDGQSATVTITPRGVPGPATIFGYVPGGELPFGRLELDVTRSYPAKIQIVPVTGWRDIVEGMNVPVDLVLLNEVGVPIPNPYETSITVRLAIRGAGLLPSSIVEIRPGAVSARFPVQLTAGVGKVTLDGSGPHPIEGVSLTVVPSSPSNAMSIIYLKPSPAVEARGSVSLAVLDERGAVASESSIVARLEVQNDDSRIQLGSFRLDTGYIEVPLGHLTGNRRTLFVDAGVLGSLEETVPLTRSAGPTPPVYQVTARLENAAVAATSVSGTLLLQMTDSRGNLRSGTAHLILFRGYQSDRVVELNDVQVITLHNGVAQVPLRTRRGSGEDKFYITSEGSALLGPVTFTDKLDRTPGDAVVQGFDITSGERGIMGGVGIRLVVTADARLFRQTVAVYVGGKQLPLYASEDGSSPPDGIETGTNVMIGYVLRKDIDWVANDSVVSFSVRLTSSAGEGPLSLPIPVRSK